MCRRAKRKWHVWFSLRAFFPANRTYLPAACPGEVGGRQDCLRHIRVGKRTTTGAVSVALRLYTDDVGIGAGTVDVIRP